MLLRLTPLLLALGLGAGETSGSMWVSTTGRPCINPSHQVTSVGTGAVTTCPATQLDKRRFIVFCNSSENTGTPKIKIRVDGTSPTMGITNPGDVLSVGDCVTYWGTAVPRCISDTSSTALISIQCQ